MELKSFYGKKVKITCVDGKVFIGVVNDYFYPDENNLGEESIVVDTISSDIIEFVENDIENISIL